MLACIVPLSQASSRVIIISSVICKMFACVIPLSQASSRVIINVFGYMLNVCLCCPVISAQQ